jgi:hypothetical protein
MGLWGSRERRPVGLPVGLWESRVVPAEIQQRKSSSENLAGDCTLLILAFLRI